MHMHRTYVPLSLLLTYHTHTACKNDCRGPPLLLWTPHTLPSPQHRVQAAPVQPQVIPAPQQQPPPPHRVSTSLVLCVCGWVYSVAPSLGGVDTRVNNSHT